MATQPQLEEEPVAQEDAPAPDNDTTQLSEVELLAVDMGWKPKGEFPGDEAKWKPAADYIRASKDIERTLKDTVKGLKDSVERMAASESKRTERALRDQAAEIEARHAQAVEDGDQAAAAKAVRDLRDLERSTADSNPEESFARENPWYGKDDDATAYAVAISQREAAKGATIPQQLKAAAEGVKKRFPELFDDAKPQGKAPPAVNAPATRSVDRRRGTGFSDLPPEVKAAAEKHAKLVNSKFGKPVEQAKADYAADYYANING